MRGASSTTSSPPRLPGLDGLELSQRIEFLGEMGGDYYDYIPFGDGRLGIVCGDVMGKGLAAALIMAMARSLLHNAVGPGRRPGDVLAEVNDGLTRDLEGQRLPYFLTLALARRTTRRTPRRHRRRRPQPRAGRSAAAACARSPSRGAALGVRTGLQFPEDVVDSASPATPSRCTPTGSPRRGPRTASSSACERLRDALSDALDAAAGRDTRDRVAGCR